MSTNFDQFGLQPRLLQAVEAAGFENPTPIQAGVIPLLLENRDIIGQAQTGTGKTAAFVLPILNNLVIERHREVQVLAMAPTRELVQQVAKVFEEMGKGLDVRTLAIYGGTHYGPQKGALRRGVDVVVGTPGRLIDLIKQKALDLSSVKTIVLDEADEMLSMGFVDDIETILQSVPDERQTTLFSATMPSEIRHLSKKYMDNPQVVAIERKQVTAETISQYFYLVNPSDKINALTRLFEVEDISSALIFVRTRANTGELAHELSVRGFAAEAINGDLSQSIREQVLDRFKRRQVKVLVATDVAARGLDIDDISHVINVDLPYDSESYVHRVGRTGRGGKEGIALTLITPRERGRLRRLESYTRQKITQKEIPTVEEIKNLRQDQLVEKMKVWIKRDRCREEKAIVQQFVDEGHDLLLVAASALKMARAEEKQRPIPPIGKVNLDGRNDRGRGRNDRNDRGRGRNDRYDRGRRDDRRPHEHGRNGNGHHNHNDGGRSERVSFQSHEDGMVRLMLSVGRLHGVRPGDVVQAIASRASIPGNTIGSIRIMQWETLVDVPERFTDQVLQHSGGYRIHEHADVKVKPAAK